MKKLLILLTALAVVGGGLAFAEEDGPAAPEVSWGVDGSFEFNLWSTNLEDENEETDLTDDEEDVVVSRPYGPGATDFVVAPWAELEWERFHLRMEGRYDHFNLSDGDDFGRLGLFSEYKDLFGIFSLYNNITYRVREYDDEAPEVTTPNAQYAYDDRFMEFNKHVLGIGASAGGFSARMNWEYTDGSIFGSNDQLDNLVGQIFGLGQFYSFNDFTMSYDDDAYGAMAKWEYVGGPARPESEKASDALPTGASGARTDDKDTAEEGLWAEDAYYLTDAYLEGKGWFGVWDVLIGDASNAKVLRLPELGPGIEFEGYTSQTGIGEFGESNFTFVDGSYVNTDRKIDTLNTLNLGALGVPLTVHLGMIVPMDEGGTTWADYTDGQHVFLGAEYAIEDVGVVNFGMGFVNLTQQPDGRIEAIVGDDGLGDIDDPANAARSNFWIDLLLDSVAPELALQIGLDGQFGKYLDIEDTLDDEEWVYDGYSVYNAAAEFEFDAEPLKIGGGVYAAFGAGIDTTKWRGEDGWTMDSAFGLSNTLADGAVEDTLQDLIDEIDEDEVWYGRTFNERNVLLRTAYSDLAGAETLVPFAFKLRADYTVSPVVSVFLANEFLSADGSLSDADSPAPGNNEDGDAAKTLLGSYGSNEITVGANLVPRENASIGIELGYKLFTGMPSEDDIWEDTDDVTAVNYELWRAGNFAPLSVSVAYSFTY